MGGEEGPDERDMSTDPDGSADDSLVKDDIRAGRLGASMPTGRDAPNVQRRKVAPPVTAEQRRIFEREMSALLERRYPGTVWTLTRRPVS